MSGKYALMWSGGKDSALALDRASKAGIEVVRLVSFYDSATRRVRFHSTRVEMLEAQAVAIGLGLRAIPTSWPDMEANLQHELLLLREEGFTGVVFGDIHLADVRAWYEERVIAAGLEHVEPIWGEPPDLLLAEFISSGGRAVITCVDLAKLDEAWLGRVIDERFASEIARTGIDACGENGEYHSYAFAGPVFKKPVTWAAGERRLDSGFAQLDLTEGG
ncbi:MAG: diphthine--ammonia ligase [Candidatus Dormibacteraceae bacterium]